MQIEVTEPAAAELQKQIDTGGVLKLAYDVEGCGCVMSGVPQLWRIKEQTGDDLVSTGNSFSLFYDKKHEVFFENRIILDYRAEHRSFRLFSNSQIYNAKMPLIDKRREDEK